MPTQNNHTKFGEIALRFLGLPSGYGIPGLSDRHREAYWAVAQALKFLKSGKPVLGGLAARLPADIDILRVIWQSLPPGTPDSLTVTLWVARIQELTASVIQAARPPASNQMLQYLYQVAQLTDVTSLDTLPASDVVPLRLNQLWESPPETQVLPVENAVLIFCRVENAKRTTLIRVSLEGVTGEKVFALASSPDLGVARQAFFAPSGEPRGDFSPDNVGDVLLAPIPEGAKESWPAFMALLDSRCQQLIGGGLLELPQRLFGNHSGNLQAFLVDAEKLRSMGLAKILGPLVRGERDSPFLNSVLAAQSNPKPVSLTIARRDLFLGHMDEQLGEGRQGFPLDPTQRLAAMTALSMRDTDGSPPIIPVNGPPGTGKTSFLRAVLASTWVRAALEKAENPPLVVGTGATNKAVSNVIDAFSTVAGPVGAGITGRWLDGLPSYGWLYPSAEARKSYPSLMHLIFDENTRTSFVPDGGAQDFRLADLDTLKATYIERGIIALGLTKGRSCEVVDIVDALHQRIASGVNELRLKQNMFGHLLESLKSSWTTAQGVNKHLLVNQGIVAALQAEFRELDSRASDLHKAVSAARQCLALQSQFERGLKRWLRVLFGNRMYVDDLRQLKVFSDAARDAVAQIEKSWPISYSERQSLLDRLKAASNEADEKLDVCRKKLRVSEARQRSLEDTRLASRSVVKSVLENLYSPDRMPPGERRNVVNALRYARASNESIRSAAENMLWHRFDAGQDIHRRFELFHFAARYWEGRWLLKQGTASKPISNQERLGQLMMLGVIIVSTTHKLPSIGKDASIDLLVVDESGQCAPEVGAAMLSFAKSALLVGDTKQLQPVPGLTETQSIHIANTLGITLPPAFCAARGSAMALARFVTPFTDQVDGHGITLLYHYRCHPMIIGYCNELLYGGKIRCVRPDKPTHSGLPPMSWVEVSGKPVQQGSSSVNEGELQEIARWVRESHRRLCEAYGKPLDEILAIIAPLKAQANKAKSYLSEALSDVIPKETLDRITIGTVHALQGAERPVVAFSLVQHRKLGGLFADRDGGFLMNVAVSRAKDAFVVFADRNTLRAGPTDKPASPAEERLPVGQLGAYLRRVGHRLYPRRLVVVEAKNKVQRIQQVLGTDCAVVATNGYLGNWSLQDDDQLSWSAPPEAFVSELNRHAGLLDELLVATDDDLAGELIGLQVAEVASETLGDLPVRRMRFHSLETEQLQDALKVAGSCFDADMLAAGLLREALNGLDRRRFQSRLPEQPYAGEAERALVALVDEFDRDESLSIEALITDAESKTFPAYVPFNEAILAAPSVMDVDAAGKIVQRVIGADAVAAGRACVQRVADLYPASTTQRVLAASADELGMRPWEVQSHLNAMYQQGAQSEGE